MIQIPPIFILGPGKFNHIFSSEDVANTIALFDAHDIPCVDPSYLDGEEFREGIEALIYSQEITSLTARINMIASGVAAIAVLPGTFASFAGMAQLFAAKALGVTIIDVGNDSFEQESVAKFWAPIKLQDFLDGLDDLR